MRPTSNLGSPFGKYREQVQRRLSFGRCWSAESRPQESPGLPCVYRLKKAPQQRHRRRNTCCKLTVHVRKGRGVNVNRVADVLFVIFLSCADVIEIPAFSEERNEFWSVLSSGLR